MQTRLSVFGITTIGELAALDDARLRELFGSWWREVRDLARGIDRRPVETERETKSISTEETFEYDVRDERRLIDVLRAQARELAETLERERTVAQTVGVKIKRADFTIVGRQTHLDRTDARCASNLSRRRTLPASRRPGRRTGAPARDPRRFAYRRRLAADEPVLTMLEEDVELGPVPLLLGVVGHRRLPDPPDELRRVVRGVLDGFRSRYASTPIVLLSALAEGADRLVAREALDAGFSLVVPLPMPREEYEKDFVTPQSLAEFRSLLIEPPRHSSCRPRRPRSSPTGARSTPTAARTSLDARSS